jgi:polysaccharide pyruvyl transferase WcaK-like protein
MKKTKPIILVHSGWNRYNFGDVAHTPGLLRLLEQHLPEAEILLWMATYPEWLEKYIGARFPSVHCISGSLGGVSGPISPAIEKAFGRADLFIYNSGPVFNYGHRIEPGAPIRRTGWRGFDWNATMQPAAKLYYAKSRGVPFGIFAQSFIYLAPPADVVLPDILSQAAFITTRETDSLAYLKELGVQASDMAFVPDAAWAFDLKDDNQVVPWLAKNGLEQGRFLAVTTRNAPAGVDEEEDAARQRTFWTELISQWIETTGLPVVLVPETAKSIQLNRSYIYEPLPAAIKEKVVLSDSLWSPAEDFWTPDQALSLLSRARAYCNVDHHGVLLALAAGVPCVHPRQPQAGRKAWVLRDIGLEDWLFDIEADTPARVGDALLEIHRNYEAARHKARQAADTVKQLHYKRMQTIRSLLNLPDGAAKN